MKRLKVKKAEWRLDEGCPDESWDFWVPNQKFLAGWVLFIPEKDKWITSLNFFMNNGGGDNFSTRKKAQAWVENQYQLYILSRLC